MSAGSQVPHPAQGGLDSRPNPLAIVVGPPTLVESAPRMVVTKTIDSAHVFSRRACSYRSVVVHAPLPRLLQRARLLSPAAAA